MHKYRSPSGMEFANKKRAQGKGWREVYLSFAKRRRKELKRARKKAKKKIKEAKKSAPRRKTKKVRVVQVEPDPPPNPFMARTPLKTSASRAKTVFDSPSILEKLKKRRTGVAGKDAHGRNKMGLLKAQCLELKATNRK